MNPAEYVDNLIKTQKANGVPLSDVAWNAALACVGYPYVFGDRGQYCTPANRRAAYNRTAEGKNKDNIKAKCPGFDSGSCSGCKWYPDGKRVREYDCRGFTYWILLQVYGWKLMGAGCTTQWNNKANWKSQGEIKDGIPQGVIVCVFYYKKDKNGKRTKTLEHTGLYYNGQTVECGAGVTHKTKLDKKWEVWGVPACVEGDVPVPTPTPPTPTPTPDRPTLRKGSKGEWVTVLQTKLSMLGYDLGPCGIDGDYGRATVSAVRAFQKDVGIGQDGICGPMTWEKLDETPKMTLYTVTIPHITLGKAKELAEEYIGASYVAEE